jgi:L-2,4-diaminobutyric acid acetyltransferase
MAVSRLSFRPPGVNDAAAIWRSAPQRGAERDSCYAFLLLCSHFSDTGVVAEEDGRVVGYALGYRPPIRPPDAFVWQLGVSEGQELSDLGIRLLEELLARRACRDARSLCMTCHPEDAALRELFQQFARRRGARCTIGPCFNAEMFATAHADELLLSVGPLTE